MVNEEEQMKLVNEDELDVVRHVPILNGVRHLYQDALLCGGGHDAGVCNLQIKPY